MEVSDVLNHVDERGQPLYGTCELRELHLLLILVTKVVSIGFPLLPMKMEVSCVPLLSLDVVRRKSRLVIYAIIHTSFLLSGGAFLVPYLLVNDIITFT